MKYKGDLVSGLNATVDARLKGVQLPLVKEAARAYRAVTVRGSRVLCDAHLDAWRAAGNSAFLTGESFAAELCDECLPPEQV